MPEIGTHLFCHTITKGIFSYRKEHNKYLEILRDEKTALCHCITKKMPYVIV